ncbi:MAG TPA: class I SAM-dependent methyltransferase [Burkholderiales bacterium]|nr:class I SAM-dependent methyltransferase [Burkholderiales bacterium]
MNLIDLGACPICGGSFRTLGWAATICPGSAEAPELRSCLGCGHWWHSPVPDQASLVELYGSASRYVVGPDEASFRAAPKPEGTFDRFAIGIIDRLERARYLEIGAGGGQMMRSVQHLGFDCYGVDPGQWTSDPAIRRSLDDWPAELTFRVFLLQDVIEHVLDPVELLERVRRRADERSVVIASFPCCESRAARLYGTRWDMVRPYGHLHYFSRQSAMALFERARWKVLRTSLARVRSLWDLLLEFRPRVLAHELLKAGPDQIYVHASV